MKDETGREELLLREVGKRRQRLSGGLVVRHGAGILATQALLGDGSPLEHLFEATGNTVSWVTDWYDEANARRIGGDFIHRLLTRATEVFTGGVQLPVFKTVRIAFVMSLVRRGRHQPILRACTYLCLHHR